MAEQELLYKKQEGEARDILQDPLVAELIGDGIPTCGGDLTSPVVDTVRFVEERSYRIGNRMYIENADGGGMPEA